MKTATIFASTLIGLMLATGTAQASSADDACAQKLSRFTRQGEYTVKSYSRPGWNSRFTCIVVTKTLRPYGVQQTIYGVNANPGTPQAVEVLSQDGDPGQETQALLSVLSGLFR